MKPSQLDHIEMSAKAIELLAGKYADGYHELFADIVHGHEETFLRFLAIMSSYRIAYQDMSNADHTTNKIGCLELCQKLEEELRPDLKDLIDEMLLKKTGEWNVKR